MNGQRLVVLDMDSTFIQQEVIDLLAAHAGVGEEVAAITERSMRGDVDFSASLAQRVALLKGLPVEIFDQVRREISLSRGAQSCRGLRGIRKYNSSNFENCRGGLLPGKPPGECRWRSYGAYDGCIDHQFRKG